MTNTLLPSFWGRDKPLPNPIEQEGLLAGDQLDKPKDRTKGVAPFSVLVAANVVLFVFSVVVLWFAQAPNSTFAQRQGVNWLLKETSYYSLIFDEIDLNVSLKTFNGRLRDYESIWHKAPSLEVDAEWDRVSMEGLELIGVSREDIVKSGKDTSLCVQPPPSWNGDVGENNIYLAQVEVFYQIRCLDVLRKEISAYYYYKGHERSESRTSRANHCIHMILQNFMCSADVGIITHNWIRNELFPKQPRTRAFEDFNTVKKCRDLDSLLAWAQRLALKHTDKKYAQLKWEPGMKIVAGDGYGPETHIHAPASEPAQGDGPGQ